MFRFWSRSFWSRSKPSGLCAVQLQGGVGRLAYVSATDQGLQLHACEAQDQLADWLACGQWLTERVRSLGIARAHCNLVLDADQYQIFMMEAPRVPDEELRDAIRWKVKDLINFPLDQAVVDVLRLPADCGRQGQKLVYAVVSERAILEPAIAAIKQAGLTLSSIDISDTALRNLAGLQDFGPRGVALLMLEAGRGMLTLIKNDCVYLSRSFAINYRGGLLDELPEEALLLELQRSFDYYERQLGQVPPATIRLLGENVTADKITETLRSGFIGADVGVLELAPRLSPDDRFDELVLQQGAGVLGAALRQESLQ